MNAAQTLQPPRLPRSIPAQNRRREELAQLRIQRRLTAAELQEEERLERALYMRVYSQGIAETERRLAAAARRQPSYAQTEGFAR